MKNNIIKLLFFNLLTITLIFITNRYNSYAASNFTFTVKDNVATITSYKGTSGNVIIPSKIGKYKVTAIGAHAFDGCSNLESVIIWGDDTLVGKDAFANCPKLKGRPIQD